MRRQYPLEAEKTWRYKQSYDLGRDGATCYSTQSAKIDESNEAL